MGTIIAVFQLVTQLFPLIDSVIQMIEKAMPQGGQGATKLALAKAFMEHAFTELHNAEVTFEQTWPVMSTLIGGLVTIYKATGLFPAATAVVTNAVTAVTAAASAVAIADPSVAAPAADVKYDPHGNIIAPQVNTGA